MRTLTEKYFGGLSLDKTAYEADLQVVDRYQSFSSELLRLSLLAITGYGFLIANIVLKSTTTPERYVVLGPWTVSALMIGAVAFGVAAATALGHRYFSTDCLTHFVRRLRAAVKQSAALRDGSDELERLADIVCEEQRSLEKDVERCRWLLLASSLFLVLGAACVAMAFAFTLFAVRAS